MLRIVARMCRDNFGRKFGVIFLATLRGFQKLGEGRLVVSKKKKRMRGVMGGTTEVMISESAYFLVRDPPPPAKLGKLQVGK